MSGRHRGPAADEGIDLDAALEIKPGHCYAITFPGALTMDDAERMRLRFEDATGARCVVFANGAAVMRERPTP